MKRFAHSTVGLVGLLGAVMLVGCKQEEPTLTLDPTKCYIDAKAVLLQAADDKDPATRSNGIEALATTMGRDAGAVFGQALGDENPMVRFAAALAIGDVVYAPAKATLQKMAADKTGDPDKRVFCAVVYALYKLGDDTHAGELGKLLFDNEREVRMDAALAMGKMGEPSAMGPLNTLVGNEQDEGVKLVATEALAMLGETRSAEVIEAYTKGYYLDLRLAAIPAMGKVGGTRAPRALKDLTHPYHPVRVRVAAAGALARMGQVDEESFELCLGSLVKPAEVLQAAAKRSKRAADTDAGSLKCLAALSLGWMNRDYAVNDLHPILRSKVGTERVAAAVSILRLLEKYRPAAASRKPPTTQPAPAPKAKAPETKPAAKPKPKLKTAGAKD